MKLLDRLVFSDLLLDLAAAPAWPYNWLMRKRMEFICRSGVDRPGVEDRSALQWKMKIKRVLADRAAGEPSPQP